jgi:hypothetical protein
MKNLSSEILSVLLCLIVLVGCKKDPVVNLPNQVDLGQSVVYLNGDLFDSEPILYQTKLNKLFYCVFDQKINNDDVGELINRLGFSLLPLKVGTYNTTTDRAEGVAAFTSFGQSFAEDLTGYNYKLEDPEDGYFTITSIDTMEQIVTGKFRAEFCRTSKNGIKEDLKMPKHLVFEGIFHEKYEVR